MKQECFGARSHVALLRSTENLIVIEFRLATTSRNLERDERIPMKIQCVLDQCLPTSIREIVERRASIKLSRFADLIRLADIHIRDVNGPKGGVDIHCRVQLSLERGGEVVAQDQATTPGDAVAGAMERISRRLSRMTKQKISQRRRVRLGTASS